jgi:4-amino-4-deoxy-L-arabinose transferase-like glycosyltransferase
MEMRRFGWLDGVLLLAVLLLAAGARGWYLYHLADGAATDGPLQVQDDGSREFEELVDNLRKGRGFRGNDPLVDREEVTAHTSPGYPCFRAVVANVTSSWADESQAVRWLQGGLGALTAGIYFLFARRAFRSLLAATLAGVLCALHPFWVVNTAELSDGVLASFLLAACLALGARGSQEGGPTASLLYGLSLAGLALVRAALLPFAVVAMLWFLARCRFVRRGWLCALLAFLGFINGLVPWTLRNFKVFGEVVPVVDSTYYHLWAGTEKGADGGPPPSGHPALPKDLQNLDQEDQPERYNRLAQRVVYNIQEHPDRVLRLRLQAGLAFVFGADWFKDKHRLWRGDDEYAAVFYGSLLGMLLLMFLGWRWSFAWRRLSMPISVAVIWVPLPYLLSHAEALSGPRLPLDGVLLSYAAFALTCFVPLRYSGGGRSLWAGPEPAPSNPV